MLRIPRATRTYVFDPPDGTKSGPTDRRARSRAPRVSTIPDEGGELLAVNDAHTTVAGIFGLLVDIRRHFCRFEMTRHVVHVAR